MKSFQITEWCHELFLMQAVTGGTYIDATMGNGHDTLFLCRLAGEEGHVLAFDIQKQALESTKALLKSEGMEQKARLILDSHENMAQYADEASVDGICFNFGYLPGSDHSLATKPESSKNAVIEGLRLLKKGGVMSLCIYSGGETGFEERDTLLAYLKSLDEKQYLVIVSAYYNRKNNPPIPVLIIKK